MAGFHIAIEKPEEIIPRLGKQHFHWKQGRSAFELANSWMRANGFPASVRDVVEQAEEWRGAKFLDGIFERETDLPGRGRPSQTDLLTVIELRDGNAILGVEGKVDESFGPLVSDWVSAPSNSNRLDRLAGLCRTLGAEPDQAGHLFYQLFHRTCASIYEAKRFGYRRAMMLVHSFDQSADSDGLPACFADFRRFAAFVGMAVERPDRVSDVRLCDTIETRLAWVTDRPLPRADL